MPQRAAVARARSPFKPTKYDDDGEIFENTHCKFVWNLKFKQCQASLGCHASLQLFILALPFSEAANIQQKLPISMHYYVYILAATVDHFAFLLIITNGTFIEI